MTFNLKFKKINECIFASYLNDIYKNNSRFMIQIARNYHSSYSFAYLQKSSPYIRMFFNIRILNLKAH